MSRSRCICKCFKLASFRSDMKLVRWMIRSVVLEDYREKNLCFACVGDVYFVVELLLIRLDL